MEKTKAFLENQVESPVINDIIEYIQKIEDFKHCEDEVQAASLLETYKLSLDHVPGHLLKSKEVKCRCKIPKRFSTSWILIIKKKK